MKVRIKRVFGICNCNKIYPLTEGVHVMLVATGDASCYSGALIYYQIKYLSEVK